MNRKTGLWISDYYIVDADTNEPYVWAANDKKKLEKRYVTLGKHDDDLEEYEIVDGLTKKDSIAFPTDALQEGETTEEGDITQTLSGDDSLGADNLDGYDLDGLDGMDGYDGTDDSDVSSSVDMTSDTGEDTEDVTDDSDDTLDPNEDLVPMDEAPGMSGDEDTEGIE